MEAIIFSDSHGNRAGMQQVLSHQVKSPDAVFFLGDGLRDFDALDTANASLYRVTGNCDWFSPLGDGKNPPTECLTALLGHTILLTHGHKFSVKSGEEHLLRHALAAGADISCCSGIRTVRRCVPFLRARSSSGKRLRGLCISLTRARSRRDMAAAALERCC